MATYERLSGLDESFLGFETPNAYMHVAVTAIFEPGRLTTANGGVAIEPIRAHVESRLPSLPRFRQRLLHVPFVGDAIWVDDDRFDLAYHVRHASLPQPGTTEQLQARCAELLERPLNRQRPLWEIWVVEGLAGGAFALVVKVHHCIVDGIAGIGMLAALLDVDAAMPRTSAPRWYPRPAPSSGDLLRDEVGRRTRAALGVGRAVRRALADPAGSVAEVGAAAESLWRLVRTGFSPAPDVCFNRPIGPHRQLAWREFDLAIVKGVARRLGGTVNDAVLTMVSGALAAALRRRGDPVPVDGLRAVVPVSMRTPEELDAPGNRVSLWLVPLPLASRSVRRRLSLIHATTERLKRDGQATGGAVVAQAANWAGGAVVEQAARLIGSARLYNLIVTNVPGPGIPLYLAGSRMRAVYPHLPLFERQGIGIALLSYAGRLHVGITADWNLGPFLADLAERLEPSFLELADAAGMAAEPPPEAACRSAPAPIVTLRPGVAAV
jgi:diacylglycerol O-acyltransferase / wax synthase